ncbi:MULTISPECIES: Sec-independent protein translocase subunit TatA [Streptomyces]|uniref:Sec-independent protein translocase protein TatA n=1 Tax=Streptomyces scabiei (strain 87.22) TaxID=680198 RepID=C9Z4E2_STRSW|nr:MULTISPECIES: Sec-independent protein translocase subunit TatA [Streptomyces]MBP5864733.1 Sec-independent protein translocase subunit TatA [Streptomyces sp. LBUM 1484]MBP5866347.1 Sec-independent protein translocase subunit TatA [Streptomyces sp. LBUM 1485]MBP5905057.1 Sec-independent protein translocase subunit TatA [Streptomyces sp. LBUM 1478]MBP5932673.1 Sec-independent protein translocase subunit TatA [Streptomyces sp. LBUM 1479]KFG07785.1 preprotein translocase subunit TatA [Streptomyc
MGNLGPTEIILILVVVVLLFGAKKLPDMARSLGKSARILKSEAKAMKSDGQDDTTPAAAPPHAGETPAQRTIQASPGDVTTARPVAEPTDTTKR